MKQVLCIILLWLIAVNANSQQNVRFSNNSDVTKVFKGTMVSIEVDTAYVLGTIKAEFINQKIKELDEIKVIYNTTAENYNKLLTDLNTVQELLEKLRDKAVSDSIAINANFTQLLNELDASLNDLKANNNELKKNNSELNGKIADLERIVKQLKKETRGIWWNGVADKIVVFVGGVGVGILLMAVF